eukprot:Gb_08157 [translate_table: standard]
MEILKELTANLRIKICLDVVFKWWEEGSFQHPLQAMENTAKTKDSASETMFPLGRDVEGIGENSIGETQLFHSVGKSNGVGFFLANSNGKAMVEGHGCLTILEGHLHVGWKCTASSYVESIFQCVQKVNNSTLEFEPNEQGGIVMDDRLEVDTSTFLMHYLQEAYEATLERACYHIEVQFVELPY